MDAETLSELLGWFIGLVAAYPMATMIITAIGTFVVIMTVLAPVIVKITWWTDKDDYVWSIVENHVIFKAILKVFSSFSLYVPKK